jgi:clan AA aspartic protease (TIGR02281 family)
MTVIRVLGVALLAAGFLCGASSAQGGEVPLQIEGGIYTVQVRINGAITLPFVLDSGASEVALPADVVLTLLRAGAIQSTDFLTGSQYQLADGSVRYGARLTLRQVELGDIRVSDVSAMVAPVEGTPLLGQSFLRRLDSWVIDNHRPALIVGRPGEKQTGGASALTGTVRVKIEAPDDGEHVGRAYMVRGTISGLSRGQQAFLVIHSTASEFGRRVYPQEHLQPDSEGRWTVRGIYATIGYAYRTYVVVTNDEAGARAMADDSSRTKGLATLPAKCIVAGPVITVHRR